MIISIKNGGGILNDDEKLKNTIEELLSKGYEGGYWDYKKDYTDCQEDKLMDLICMANNIEGQDAYLIYGANNDGTVFGIENTSHKRYTSKELQEFLRTKMFAGDYVPSISVNTIKIDGHELDVVTIHNTNKTPYYLKKDFNPSKDKPNKKLRAGAIYTRVNDINTPRELTASLEHTEYLWRKRFGIEKTPSQKLMLLLDDINGWSETEWDEQRYSYNIQSPEYQIIVLESDRGYETLRYFYDDENMLYAPVKLNYLTTTLYETELWYMDMGRCKIPKPRIRYIIESHILYYYIEKNTIEGKLLPFFTNERCKCCNRSGSPMPILIFDNKYDREKFEKWMLNHISLRTNYEKSLQQSAIFQHIQNKEMIDGKSECGVLEVATSFEFYKEWEKSEELSCS